MLQVTIDLLHKAMLKSDKKVFLIDGFPRALDQAEAFEKQVRLDCDHDKHFCATASLTVPE
jgi:adenylate kinase family enzyme